jgi:dipeptidyl aminopeptidase/acylaminoacyl peptidase
MKKLIFVFVSLFFINSSSYSQLSPFTTADVLKVQSFSLAEITNNGNYAAGFLRSRMDRMDIDHRRYGDPNYVAAYTSKLLIINSESGEKIYPWPSSEIFGAVKWSPDGSKLAILKYDLTEYHLYLFDVEKQKLKKVKLNSENAIASRSALVWNTDAEKLVLSTRSLKWSNKGDSLFKEATVGPRIVYDSKQPHLKWDAIRAHNNLSILTEVNLKNGKSIPLTEEGSYNNVRVTEDGQDLLFNQNYPLKTVYDRKGGTEYELKKLTFKSKEKSILEKRTKLRVSRVWNEQNTAYAYADSGKVFLRNIYKEDPKLISLDTTEIIKGDTSKVKFTVNQWSPDNLTVLAASKKGYWLIDPTEKEMKMVYEFPEDKEKAPQLNIVNWTSDAKVWYMTYSAKDKWERGLVKYDLQSGKTVDLIKDSNLYTRWNFSKDGKKAFYNFSDGNQPNDLYLFRSETNASDQLTDLNPWIKNKKLTKSELIKYRDSDGNELNGILYYPVDYEKGKKYPLVCEIYESFFNNGYSYSMNLVANAGYFGFKPSVHLEKGYPGEAWIKGITAGINKLIDKGLVDEDKLGVHGTSYGGYAASLLISQTDRFAAAINISGKVNIISFLGDSPRIGTRNYSAAEVGQDRIGQSLWEAPLKYFQTSAVLFADRIETPHLLLTGDADWNVPAVNSRELYYALRRLGKEVKWVNYYNGGHGAGASSNEADFYDHWKQIIDWYSSHFDKKSKK